ncbi:hypothetical protein B0T09DRAFT_396337 [Sordaria sp. MPI-SDFR-AT-0083]|nr:hypothetical protein B0T09DRAFT_396337 [Sordaria sp. MPI-SDFR-AT-0083]
MSETIQLPSFLKTSMAVDLLPVVKLHHTFVNFEEWEHSVRFYLRYHKLLGFLEEDDTIRPVSRVQQTSDKSDNDLLHRRLFVYSIIWRSGEAVLCRSTMSFSNQTPREGLLKEVYQNRQHDPKLLWDAIRAEGYAVEESKSSWF